MQGDYSARMSEIQEKARIQGLDSLTPAEVRLWADLRGAMSNIDASRNLVLHRAQITGGSEETTQEIVKIMGQTGIAASAAVAGGISKAGKSAINAAQGQQVNTEKGKEISTVNGYKISNGADNVIAKTNLDHPIVQSRINVQNGDSKAGWEHVIKRHFSGKDNASQFTISQSEVKNILKSSEVTKIPISNTRISINKTTGQKEILYERVITFDRNIGVDKFSDGKPTNTMTILTDKHGNLITATPGKM